MSIFNAPDEFSPKRPVIQCKLIDTEVDIHL